PDERPRSPGPDLAARGESLAAHSGPPARLPRWGPRSTGDASPAHPNAAAALGTPAGAALLLLQILAVFSVVAPCPRGASPVSVRRQTFTPGCSGASRNQMSCSR